VKVYRLTFHAADEGAMLSWHSSKRDAERALRERRQEFGEAQGPDDIEAIDIPTDRAGLLTWLNREVTLDNG
jgi:hypothetical protein